jgi:hypothetical protein
MTDADTTAINTLSINYRYIGAWNEVGTRLALRQNALTMYVTLASAILTILATSQRIGIPFDVSIFSLTMPAISLFLAFLNFKHDKTILLLRSFLRECENNGISAELRLPGYNSIDFYRQNAEWYRNFHDYSAAILILMFSALGFDIAYSSFPYLFDPKGWPAFLYIILSFISILFVIHTSMTRNDKLTRPEKG